ncbi:MAG: glycerate kinase [Bacteroidaceae bacterium]|nr:glycerate kinase [Bacteroidaceae bacterium]
MKITLAFDSFKGSLTSHEVAEAFEEGLLSCIPACDICKVVIADGGEGTTEALVESMHGVYVNVAVSDPLQRTITARYGIVDNGNTAVIEMAKASGLPLLAHSERNPLMTTTYGTGQMILDAIDRGCRNFLIGIGGSATNDGGMGMLSALGYRFLDKESNPLPGIGKMLAHVASIDDTLLHPTVKECTFRVACDVTNPLYGENGAAYIFAPQKGADATMVAELDNGLRNYAQVITQYNGYRIDTLPGAGAAGGMGGGLKALLDAQLIPGIQMVLETIKFDQLIANSTLVVTGEGCIDYQTVMGKAPGGVLQAASQQNIPVAAIGGKVKWCDELCNSNYAAIIPITPDDMPLVEAMKPDIARENVRKAATRIAQLFNLHNNTLK